MTTIKTRIRIALDGTLTGQAAGLPAGEHEAEITVLDAATGPAGVVGRSYKDIVTFWNSPSN